MNKHHKCCASFSGCANSLAETQFGFTNPLCDSNMNRLLENKKHLFEILRFTNPLVEGLSTPRLLRDLETPCFFLSFSEIRNVFGGVQGWESVC